MAFTFEGSAQLRPGLSPRRGRGGISLGVSLTLSIHQAAAKVLEGWDSPYSDKLTSSSLCAHRRGRPTNLSEQGTQASPAKGGQGGAACPQALTNLLRPRSRNELIL